MAACVAQEEIPNLKEDPVKPFRDDEVPLPEVKCTCGSQDVRASWTIPVPQHTRPDGSTRELWTVRCTECQRSGSSAETRADAIRSFQEQQTTTKCPSCGSVLEIRTKDRRYYEVSCAKCDRIGAGTTPSAAAQEFEKNKPKRPPGSPITKSC